MKVPPLLLILAAAFLCADVLAASPTLAEETAARAAEKTALLAAAERFYTELRKEPVYGIPSEDQMQRLGSLITPELRTIFERARVLQEEQIRNYPDEKPRWIEGDLFSSSFEGATSWELGEAFHAPSAEATVKVNQTYSESNEDIVSWTDTFVFRQEEGAWLLDDIRMGGEWAFKSGASLRGMLPGGGKDYEDHFSLDERWRVAFERDGDEVVRVAVRPAGFAEPATVLFGGEGDEPCPMPTWVVWSPEDDRIALRLGDGPRFTRTLIFQLLEDHWVSVPMPEFFPEERKALEENGFRERDRLVDAERWHDANTLVVKYFGLFEKGDEGDGYHREVHLRVDPEGNAAVVGWNEISGEE
jgi:hypothetical protein